ncbi:MAG: MCE family protein, partial [Actinomadura sp.]
MLTLAIRLKVLAFLVLGVTVLAYIGSNYADIGRYFGMRGYYLVKLDLAEAGGIFPNANITYRGVSVGRVGELNLTDAGVQAELKIENSAPPIPANVQAVVANLSAVGEQYVDLRPVTAAEPYLTDGAVIAQHRTRLPPPVTSVLTAANDFTSSVPLESLRTVVDELDKSFRGQGPNLQVLLDNSSRFTQAASASLPETSRLITDAQFVLQTQVEQREALAAFGRDARLFAGQLRESDGDFRDLIAVTPDSARAVSGLFRDVDPSLSVVLANLLTTSDLAVTRRDGIEQLLVRLPQAVSVGSTAITPQGARFGLALTFFSPLPCTAGYGGTTYRNGLDTSAGPPLNTAARCTMPASSGVNVRGSANAPRGG